MNLKDFFWFSGLILCIPIIILLGGLASIILLTGLGLVSILISIILMFKGNGKKK